MELINKNVLLKKLGIMLESIQCDIQKAKYDSKILVSELETVQSIITMVAAEKEIVNEKEIPKDVLQFIGDFGKLNKVYKSSYSLCPCCNEEFPKEYMFYDYCMNCGQRLKWNGEVESE